MIKLTDKIRSLFYRLLRSEAPNGFNICKKCRKKRRNWNEISKKHTFIGYDQVLGEWVSFTEHNMYAKAWAMNGYITNLTKRTDELDIRILPLCRKCITDLLNNKG